MARYELRVKPSVAKDLRGTKAAQPMTAAALGELQVDARAGNTRRDVTDALVYVDGVFIRSLEGERDDVDRLLASLAADPRHRSLKVFYEGEIERRAFASWRVAHVAAAREQMLAWAGLPAATTIEELLAEPSSPRHLPRPPAPRAAARGPALATQAADHCEKSLRENRPRATRRCRHLRTFRGEYGKIARAGLPAAHRAHARVDRAGYPGCAMVESALSTTRRCPSRPKSSKPCSPRPRAAAAGPSGTA